MQNPNVKTISLDTPAKEEREALVTGPNFPSFFDGSVYVEEYGYYKEHPEELRKIQNRFVALTEGFSFTELNGLRKLCKNEQISIRDIEYMDGTSETIPGIHPFAWDALKPKYSACQTAGDCAYCIGVAAQIHGG